MSEQRHRLEIAFCTACKFQGRAFWTARELFDQRPDRADEYTLVPSSNGVFTAAGLARATVRYDGDIVWDYAVSGRFPEPKEVREAILAASGRAPSPPKHSGLGHR